MCCYSDTSFLIYSAVAKTFDYESLYKNLEQISIFEKRANSRVIESGLLKGINLEDIKRVGELLVLQDGCKDFFQESVKMKEKITADFHVLSCCWCADLIRSAFSSGKYFVANFFLFSSPFEFHFLTFFTFFFSLHLVDKKIMAYFYFVTSLPFIYAYTLDNSINTRKNLKDVFLSFIYYKS